MAEFTLDQKQALALAAARRRLSEQQGSSPIEVELPDGTIAEFPAGTSNGTMRDALRRKFPASTGVTREQARDELNRRRGTAVSFDDLIPGKPSLSTLALSEAVERLTVAPGTTTLDALAFAAIARRLLTQALQDMPPDDEGAIEQQPQGLTVSAVAFLQRAIEVLEAETGFSAEGFTGEADAVN